MKTGESKITRITFDDQTDGGDRYNGYEPASVSLGDTFKGVEVQSIEVTYPDGRGPLVTIGNDYESIVIPDCRVFEYLSLNQI